MKKLIVLLLISFSCKAQDTLNKYIRQATIVDSSYLVGGLSVSKNPSDFVKPITSYNIMYMLTEEEYLLIRKDIARLHKENAILQKKIKSILKILNAKLKK